MEVLSPFKETYTESIRPTQDRSRELYHDFDLEDLYHVLQIEPHNSVAAMALAKKLIHRGRLDEALKVARSLVRLDSSYPTLMLLGRLEYDLGLSEEAQQDLYEALLLSGEDGEGQFEIFKMLGNLHVKAGEFELAEDNYYKAHRLNPISDVLLVNMGTLAIQKSQWDESLQLFRDAVGLNPANDRAWVGLAVGHRMKGDFELSWGNLENALELNPLNEAALTLANDWGRQDGRDERVLELLRSYVLEGGPDEDLSLAFAEACWRRGMARAAQLEVERILAFNPCNEKASALAELWKVSRDRN
ncbi:MAG: tetratricopeptide repeat protein [Bdellovibrionales bacterium]